VAAAGALLAAAIVADKIAIVDAAVPLGFVCLLHAIWASTPRTGWRAQRDRDQDGRRGIRLAAGRLRAQWFELSVAVASAAAVAAAQLIITGVSRFGGFAMLPVQTGMVTPEGVPGHLSMALRDTLNLFGADVATTPPGPQTVMAWLHAPGVALAVAAFAVAAWRVPCQRDLVSDVLAVGIVVNLAGFVASVIPATPFDTRELAAVLPFGAVLAGRVFGPWLTGETSARASTSGVPLAWRFRLRPGVAALAVAGACQLAALGYGATRPPAADPEQALAGWLAAHRLTDGLGTFTDGNVTTLDSGGTVRLATVSWSAPLSDAAPQRHGPHITGAGGGAPDEPPAAVPRLYQSSASWYDPHTGHANFVVTGTADGPADLIPRAEILALAGPPARTYQFESFTIMVWNQNLLALLGSQPSRTPGDIGHP